MSNTLFTQGYDFNKKSESIALDSIFVSTGYRIPEPKIKFGKPFVMDIRPDIDDDPNTYVSCRIQRSFDQRLGTESGFIYRRLPLTLLSPTTPVIRIDAPQIPFNTSEVLNQINEILNSKLTINDLLELSYTAEDNEIILISNPDSLAWYGFITMRVNTGYVPPIVEQANLSGFTVYNPIP